MRTAQSGYGPGHERRPRSDGQPAALAARHAQFQARRRERRFRTEAGDRGDRVERGSASKPAGGKSAAGRPAKKPAAKRTPGKRTTVAGSTSASARGRAGASASAKKPAEAKAAASQPRQEEATQGSTDPVTGAVLLAGKVVEGGLKVASGIIKRLPAPVVVWHCTALTRL